MRNMQIRVNSKQEKSVRRLHEGLNRKKSTNYYSERKTIT